MNTITPAASSHQVSTPSGQATRTRLRITRRGRRVVAMLAATPLVAAAAIAIINGGAALGSNEQGVSADAFDSVTVMPGDTLWSIAEDVAPQEDPRDVVDEISDLNRLSSSTVDTGQRLFLPIAYSAGH
ncbi:hypothetical protein GCM10010922_08360 [Microbacterium sorbitolivorans]|uniref:LysM peptidoglycan-binding domain-containing protein n=1 Tax=Microbacterium sorbitolivorans TaxID=1867410 RepID=A0A367XXI3_9MICO|nr:LysM peptidoglycan-binding domain-containing protein [Microbacterium sorbitolivorans]RCK58323.1 LysM peptidoglycan-binding domain-containing protein [Microbacterium sorbitolivorans]GGF35534.1 hypothetical protein GCM10010922_08360 [Microbacterium sorbitolivorans]